MTSPQDTDFSTSSLVSGYFAPTFTPQTGAEDTTLGRGPPPIALQPGAVPTQIEHLPTPATTTDASGEQRLLLDDQPVVLSMPVEFTVAFSTSLTEAALGIEVLGDSSEPAAAAPLLAEPQPLLDTARLHREPVVEDLVCRHLNCTFSPSASGWRGRQQLRRHERARRPHRTHFATERRKCRQCLELLACETWTVEDFATPRRRAQSGETRDKEALFAKDPNPSEEAMQAIADRHQTTLGRVLRWFQTRRAVERDKSVPPLQCSHTGCSFASRAKTMFRRMAIIRKHERNVRLHADHLANPEACRTCPACMALTDASTDHPRHARKRPRPLGGTE